MYSNLSQCNFSLDIIAAQCMQEISADADSVFAVYNDECSSSNFAAANITIDTDAAVTVICFWYRSQELSTIAPAFLSILAGPHGM